MEGSGNGRSRFETAEAKADRIAAEELSRLQWTPNDLVALRRSHPAKLPLAARLWQQTTLSVNQIAERLHLGKPKGARSNLHKFMNCSPSDRSQIQLHMQ